MPTENPEEPVVAARGANGQRPPRARGGRTKRTSTNDAALQEELQRLHDEIAAAHKKLEEHAARGTLPAPSQVQVQRIERPKGEAGDKKNGFVLQDAMGLEDDRATYEAILRSVHANVARANIDMTVDFRRQDAAKLAAVYKLTRKGFPYLTRDRFPLDWATAEVVKQYLRNKRRYAVKRGFIPKRADRKRQHEEVAQGSNGRPRTGAGDVPHIDDMDEDEI